MKNKIKTHKGTVKRFKVTGTGKVLRRKMSQRHNSHLKNKRRSTRNLLPERFVIDSKAVSKKIKRMLNN